MHGIERRGLSGVALPGGTRNPPTLFFRLFAASPSDNGFGIFVLCHMVDLSCLPPTRTPLIRDLLPSLFSRGRGLGWTDDEAVYAIIRRLINDGLPRQSDGHLRFGGNFPPPHLHLARRRLQRLSGASHPPLATRAAKSGPPFPPRIFPHAPL